MYKQKYFKYKQKYLDLKNKNIVYYTGGSFFNQIGSGQLDKDLKQLIKKLPEIQQAAKNRNDQPLIHINDNYVNNLINYMEKEEKWINEDKSKLIDKNGKEFVIDASKKLSDELNNLKENENADNWKKITDLQSIFFRPEIKTFSSWIINSYIKGSPSKLEDIGSRLEPAIKNFKLLQKSNPGKYNQEINNFDGLSGLEDFLDKSDVKNDLEKIVGTQKINKGKQGGILIYDGKAIKIFKPITTDGACYYGQGTRWCTAATTSENMFEHYNKQGPLYIIQPKNPQRNGEKYEIHFMSSQYMDEKDDPIKLNNLINLYPEISNILNDKEIFQYDIPIEFLNSVSDTELLKNVKELKISGDKLLKNFLPQGLTSLTFGYNFANGGEPLNKDSLPQGLTSLTFGKDFNNGGQSLNKDSLPQGLTSLTFGDDFNNGGQPLNKNSLPQTLTSLAFGDGFTNGHQPLNKDSLPQTLISLTFGNNFNNGSRRRKKGPPLNKDSLPQGLISLTFGDDFNNGGEPLNKDSLPQGLTSLTFGYNFANGGEPLNKDSLPQGLTSLTFGYNFNNGGEPLNKDSLPQGLTSLTYGYNFANGETPLNKDSLPQGLTSLTFGNLFNNGDQPLNKDSLPQGLISLTFGDDFNNGGEPLNKDSLPQGLTSLTFGIWFENGRQPLNKDSLPQGLISLTFDDGFKNGGEPLKKDSLPQGLTSVRIGEKKHKIN